MHTHQNRIKVHTNYKKTRMYLKRKMINCRWQALFFSQGMKEIKRNKAPTVTRRKGIQHVGGRLRNFKSGVIQT